MSVTKNSVAVLTKFQPESKRVAYNVAWDNSYPTGGQNLDCTDHFKEIGSVMVESGFAGYVIEPVTTNYATAQVKLRCWRQTAATGALVEVPNTTDLSAALNAVRVVVTGKAL